MYEFRPYPKMLYRNHEWHVVEHYGEEQQKKSEGWGEDPGWMWPPVVTDAAVVLDADPPDLAEVVVEAAVIPNDTPPVVDSTVCVAHAEPIPPEALPVAPPPPIVKRGRGRPRKNPV